MISFIKQIKNIKSSPFKIKRNINFDADLNDNEKYVINYLKNILKFYNREDVELRVAGGWVRDKLLNYKNDKLDLDFAINKISGVDLLNMIQKYRKEEEKNDKEYDQYTIKMNPEKSKHLETVSIKINDFTVELNALRSDTYQDENSRIPQIQVGTPLSDCLRRDLTINSLFYNINTMQIEDYSGLGLSDLENGIVRTPLEPFNTLTEDPLRAFRILRFATKFNFTIEPSLYKHIKTINSNIIKKVSKERIYEEFKLMMSFRRYSEQYFSYLLDTGIISAMFIWDRMSTKNNNLDPQEQKEIQDLWGDSLQFIKISNRLFSDSNEIENLGFYLTLIFYPLLKSNKLNSNQISSILVDFKSPLKYVKQMKKNFELSELFTKLVLKYINYLELMGSVNYNGNEMEQLKQFLDQQDETNELVYILKKNPDWNLALYLTLIDIKFNLYNLDNSNNNNINNYNNNNNNNNFSNKIYKLFNLLGLDNNNNNNINQNTNNNRLKSIFNQFNQIFKDHYYPKSQIRLLVDGKELAEMYPKFKYDDIKKIYLYQINNHINNKEILMDYLNKLYL